MLEHHVRLVATEPMTCDYEGCDIEPGEGYYLGEAEDGSEAVYCEACWALW